MIQPIYEFAPSSTVGREIHCAKCKQHRPEAGSVEFVDGHGRRKRACVSCKRYVKAGPRK